MNDSGCKQKPCNLDLISHCCHYIVLLNVEMPVMDFYIYIIIITNYNTLAVKNRKISLHIEIEIFIFRLDI